MLPYFSTAAPTSEPEGWDAADILQLQNPATGRWSCPTLTKRNRRCENVVSQERSIKVKFMLNSMSVEDAGEIVKDKKRELTDLAETMLCPLHFGGIDGGEKVKGVVAEWRNYIKTSMRTQAQDRTVRHRPTAPTVGYQPAAMAQMISNAGTSTHLHGEQAPSPRCRSDLGPWLSGPHPHLRTLLPTTAPTSTETPS